MEDVETTIQETDHIAGYRGPDRAVPTAHSTHESSSRLESWAIWVAIAAAVLAAGLGSLLFRGQLTPLSASFSVGTVAGWSAAIGAGASSLIGMIIVTGPRLGTLGWMRRRLWVWWMIDLIGLVIIHAAIATLAALSTFRLFQQAFQGLEVDAIAATVMLAVVCAAASYFGFNSAARASTSSLSILIALFMGAGMLASMLLAENPYWWHAFFSELGTGQAGVLSFWTFNTTITVSGMMLITLANFITQDLYAWAEHRRATGGRRAHVRVLKGGMMIIGVCMIGLSWVQINVNDPIHTAFVQVLAVVFILMLLTIPIWLPGVPAALYAMSYLMLGLGVVAVVLWEPLGYYNLTALELAFAGIIFAWLVVLIRTVDAMVQDLTHDDADPQVGVVCSGARVTGE